MRSESVCDRCHKDDDQDDAVPENVDRLLTLLDEINPEAAEYVREVVVDPQLHATMSLSPEDASRFDNAKGMESTAEVLNYLFNWDSSPHKDYGWWEDVYIQLGEYEKAWFDIDYDGV